MSAIAYRKGYQFELVDDFSLLLLGREWVECFVGFQMPNDIEGQFLSLSRDGRLTVRAGYQWDAASSVKETIRAGMVRAALRDMMRDGRLADSYMQRLFADRMLRKLCRADGAGLIRSWWIYLAARWRNGKAHDAHPVLNAPAN